MLSGMQWREQQSAGSLVCRVTLVIVPQLHQTDPERRSSSVTVADMHAQCRYTRFVLGLLQLRKLPFRW